MAPPSPVLLWMQSAVSLVLSSLTLQVRHDQARWRVAVSPLLSPRGFADCMVSLSVRDGVGRARQVGLAARPAMVRVSLFPMACPATMLLFRARRRRRCF